MTTSGLALLHQAGRSIAGRRRLIVVVIAMTSGLSALQPVAGQDATQIIQDSEYARGVQAFAEGDFEQAADLWLTDAYRGAADAQFNVGVLYLEGRGLPEDRSEAIFWFTKAAKQGHPESQYNLGHLLLEQTGDVDMIRQGIDWWRQSAESGFPVAQYNYGRALFYGVGVAESREASRPWIEKAAEGGNTNAQNFLEQNTNNFVDEVLPASVTEPRVAGTTDDAISAEPPPSIAEVAGSEYVLVKDKPILMYSRFNTFSPIITRVGTKIILRVVARKRNWILAEVPGGVPGWVRNDQLSSIEPGKVEIAAEAATIYADPTENTETNDIGKLLKGTRPVLLEQQPGWSRIQLPEKIPGWIEADQVVIVESPPQEISRLWQAQRIKQKITALSSSGIKVAGVPRQQLAVIDRESVSETVIEPLAEAEPEPRPATTSAARQQSAAEAQVTEKQAPDADPKKASAIGSEPYAEAQVLAQQASTANEKKAASVEPEPTAIEQTVSEPAPTGAEPESEVAAQVESEQTPVTEEVESAADETGASAEAQAVTEETRIEPEFVVEMRVVSEQEPAQQKIIATAPETGPQSESAATSETEPETQSDPEKIIVSPRKAIEQSNSLIVSETEEDRSGNTTVGQVLEQGVIGQDQFVGGQATIWRTTAAKVPVRAGPDANEPQIVELPLNTLVDIVGKQRGFAEITIPGGIPVWIPEAAVRLRDQEVVIEANRVRARLRPGRRNEPQGQPRILGIIPQGSVLRLVQRQGEWLRVVAPEWITGWIETENLEPPEVFEGIERFWRQQANTLLTGYLGEDIVELAVVPGLDDGDLIGTGIMNDNQWLFESTSRKFTLQLFSMQNRSSAQSLFRSLRSRGQFFSTVVNGERWYFMLIGKFLTPEAAEAVAEKLPRWASEGKARSLIRLQVNRCKKVDQLNEEESRGLDQLCRD